MWVGSAANMRRKQSLLDSVAEEATRMRRTLGPADDTILAEAGPSGRLSTGGASAIPAISAFETLARD
jgi:hypothetical protein